MLGYTFMLLSCCSCYVGAWDEEYKLRLVIHGVRFVCDACTPHFGVARGYPIEH